MATLILTPKEKQLKKLANDLFKCDLILQRKKLAIKINGLNKIDLLDLIQEYGYAIGNQRVAVANIKEYLITAKKKALQKWIKNNKNTIASKREFCLICSSSDVIIKIFNASCYDNAVSMTLQYLTYKFDVSALDIEIKNDYNKNGHSFFHIQIDYDNTNFELTDRISNINKRLL